MKPILLLLSLLFAFPVWAQTKVTIRVIDPQNAPVVGASVETQIWRERAAPIPAQITDADGAVTLELPNSVDGKPVNGGVSVVAKGFAFNNAALTGKDLEIRLQPGATWRGKVSDEAGKPIEGAVISVTGAMKDKDWNSRISLYGEKNSALYRVKSGADGVFAVNDVPAQLGLSFGVEHPDYAVKNGNGVLADAEAIFKLAPGGALKGRVLDVAGKPIAGATVYATISRFGGGNGGKTDENGAFTIRSLAAGTYSVGAYLETARGNADFVLPRVTGVAVEVGKTADAPDLRAVSGFEIQGMVRDAATKKPLAGASIHAQNGDETGGSGLSDATGRFKLRVLAGRYKIYISGPPEGYVRPEEQKSVLAGEATKNEAEIIFDLKKATLLRGTIVDEAGKPLQAKLKVDWDSFIESDAQGKWQFQPQNEQTLQLAGGDAEDGYFEVVSPLTIQIGTETETTITLRKKPWQVLPGRALTTDGKPLQGVQIEGSFTTPMGDGNGTLNSSQRSATTNANGDFVLPQIRDGIRSNSNFFQIKAKKEGYAFQKGGELSKNGPVWQVSDFIFVPLNLAIEGKTAPGARVTMAGIETVAGADGQFQLQGLPASETRIWAFKGDGFGGAAAKSPAQIELQPQSLQARDEELARDIWNDILLESGRGTKGPTYGSLSWVERRLATAAGEADFAAQLEKTTGDMALSRLAERFAGKVDFALLEPVFERIKSADTRVYSYLSAAAKAGDKTLAARALQEAETNFGTPEKEVWWREMNLYRAASVATRFESEAAGFKALDRAVAFTLKNHGEKSTRQGGMPAQTGRDEMFALQAEVVAHGGNALVKRLISNIDPGAGYESRALGEAIPILAKNEGAESVLPLFDELEKMPEPIKRDEGYSMPPQRAFAIAAVKVVPLLGAASPQKALELARRVRDENYGNETKWQTLAGAARFQNAEVAAQLWREIVNGAGAETASRYAARAFETDAKLGRELFQIARQKVEAESKNEWQGRELWASYAFYSARAEAAQARFLLEREWGAARQKQTEGEQLGALALAMAALDGPRAWQMAREIPADNFSSSLDTRRKIGIYLAASEEKRRDFPFGRQNNWEEWRELEME